MLALSLMGSSITFIKTFLKKYKFPFILNVEKMSFMLSPKSIFNFYFYIQTLYDKQIKKFIAVMLNQIQDLKSSIGFPSVTGI